jgi:hypothetical protein
LALLHTKNILDTAMNLLGVVQLETIQLGEKLAISKLNSYIAQKGCTFRILSSWTQRTLAKYK